MGEGTHMYSTDGESTPQTAEYVVLSLLAFWKKGVQIILVPAYKPLLIPIYLKSYNFNMALQTF